MSRHEDRGELGRGGMSVVRRAFDPQLQRETALKRLAPAGNVDMDVARERFLDEARITGNLEHPNVVPVYEYGEEGGVDFMTMKLVEGRTLGEVLREQGDERLDPENLAFTLDILLRVCDAVAYAHHMGIVHRDLKPANVMVGEFGEVYVVDWGIARRLADPPDAHRPEGTTLGTPSYMAPEQIESPDSVDQRADIYCLGGLLYYILTGCAPHHGKAPIARMTVALYGRVRDVEDMVDDPRLPRALVRIVRRALETDPEDRYPNVRVLRREVESFVRGAWALPTRHVAAGEAVVVEGEPGAEAFLIRSGRCHVSTERVGFIRELGPGDVFGELAILADRPRTATITAIDDVELLVVDRDVLTEELGLNSWMGRFVKALATRFADLERELR